MNVRIQRVRKFFGDEVCRITREILLIDLEIRYDTRELRVRIRDDGKVGLARRPGKSAATGARLDFLVRSRSTEVELTVPAALAYGKARQGRRFRMSRQLRTHGHSSKT
jgi:hypothetical protein